MDRGLAKSLEPTHGIGNAAHAAQTVARLMGPFQVGCLMFTLPHTLPCDFHLPLALPSTPSPLLGSLALSHCTAFSNTRQYCGSEPANYLTPKNGTRSKLLPAHTLFLNRSRLLVHSSCSGSRSFRARSEKTHRTFSATHAPYLSHPQRQTEQEKQWTQWHTRRRLSKPKSSSLAPNPSARPH
jgi:hypothetical protein